MEHEVTWLREQRAGRTVQGGFTLVETILVFF
jgi:hypothetical protein